MRTRINVGTHILGLLALLSGGVTLWAIFVYAPTEQVMGTVQRIFYIHAPSAWVAYLAFFVVFLSSLAYLLHPVRGFLISWLMRLSPAARDALRPWLQGRPWDRLAHSAAEIGVLFTSLALITGSLWGRQAWGTWWEWGDARLVTTLILWFIYVGYLMLRAYVDDPQRRARFAAVLGIVGFVDVPIVHLSVTWWRTLHPLATVVRLQGPDLPSEMLRTLMLSMFAFTLLYFYLLLHRYRLERMRDEVQEIKVTLEARGVS